MTDKELVEHALAGDVRAAEEIAERTVGLVYSVAFSYAGGERAVAEDLQQKAMVKIMESLKSFGPPYNLKAWAVRITHNCGIDHARKNQTRNEAARELAHTMNDCPDDDPETELLKQEKEKMIRRALDSLSEDGLKKAIELFYFHEMTVADIAEREGISQTAVTTRLSRGRGKLRKSLLYMSIKDKKL
ncbi:MAG: sigma-70 family RNA polymerase sigma factor [bacterium]